MIVGAAYYPEHRDPDKWEYDLDLMAAANLDAVRVGEFAWTFFEPADGRYDFEWMDRFSILASQRGIGLLLCPPLRTVPAWMIEHNPSLKIETESGVRLEYGSRYSFCINNSYLQEKGARLAEAMGRHYGKSMSVIGWHLDNEHGDEPDCHCPVCRREFQEWCRRRYGNIEALNESWGLAFWGLRFNHFQQVPTPRRSKTFHGPGHLLAWRRFRSDSTVAAVALQSEVLRPYIGLNQFITTNNQVGNNRTDYFDMAHHLDRAGTNYYPPYGSGKSVLGLKSGLSLAMCRSYKKHNFQVHELRNGAHMIPEEGTATPAPGEVERLTMHCVANGAEAVFYFRWRACPFGSEQGHGTITDYDGRPKRVYAEVQQVAKKLKKIQDLLNPSFIMADVGVLIDFPTRWVMETGIRWNGPSNLYMKHAETVYRAVRRCGVNCDAVGRDDDFSDHKILIVPALATINDQLAEKFIHFVEDGGTLVWHPFSGIKDEEAVIFPERLPSRLRNFFGLEVREFATADPGDPIPFEWEQKPYQGRWFCDLPQAATADVVGQFREKWFAGTPAVLKQEYGNGISYYVATFAQEQFYRDLCTTLLENHGIDAILPHTVPDGVEVTERRTLHGESLVFLLNGTDQTVQVEVGRRTYDVYNDAEVDNSVELPPFGVAVLSNDRA